MTAVAMETVALDSVAMEMLSYLHVQGYAAASSMRDVVISCPPRSPPYAIRALCHCISGCVPSACRVFVHSSSSSSIPEDLRDFLSSLPSDPKPVLRVVLIWKSGKIPPCRRHLLLSADGFGFGENDAEITIA